jgi:hypothetical protein
VAQQVEILSLNIDTKQLVSKLAETKSAIEQLQASQKALQQAGQASSQEYIKQSATLKNLQSQYNKQHNVLTQIEAAQKDAASASAAMTTALKREVTSIDAATENNKQLRAVRNQVNASSLEGKAVIDALNKKINENTEFIKANTSELEKSKMNVGNYKQSISEALDAINPFNGGIAAFNERSKEAGGAGNLFKQSFTQLSQGIMGATKAGLTFIATPIGAAIAALTAAFAAGKAIFDYNQGLQEANKELKALGVNAADLSNVRSEVQATAETFDKDFKEIASAANSLAKSFGISMSESNNVIAQGLANGGAQNEEFLDSLSEYDTFFQNAGYSATEFANIVNQGFSAGVYSDKLPDALKEADLSLKEQTKSTRDALVNAFGAPFTDEILKKVRVGEITTKEALDSISKKAGESSLTQQQYAQLTADVFKGAGEDIGGSAKFFDILGQAAKKNIGDTASAQLQLQQSTEQLNKAQADLFEVKGFGDMWTGIKIVSTDALTAMLKYIADVKKDIQPLIDFVGIVLANAFTTLKTTVSVAFNVIANSFKVIANAVSTFFNFFKALVSGDFSGAISALKNGFTNLLNIVNNTFGSIKNNILDGLKAIVGNVAPILNALGVDVEKLQKKLEGLKSKNLDINTSTIETKTTSTKGVKNKKVVADKPTDDDSKRVADEQAKIRAEKQKTADAAIAAVKEEIDYYVASQGIKKKSLADQLKFEEQLLSKRMALAETEYKAGKISKTQYETQKLNLSNEYLKKQGNLILGEAEKEINNYRKSIELKQKDDKKFTEDKLAQRVAENNNLLAKEIEYHQLRRDNGLINEQEYLDAVTALKEQNRVKNEEAQKLLDEAVKEQQMLDLENKNTEDQARAEDDFELQQIRLKQKYDADIKAARDAGKTTSLIEKDYKKESEKIEAEKQNAKLTMAANTLGSLTSLLGEESAAGKATALAQALINTYLGITAGVKLGFPAAIPAVAAAAATGFGAVKNITATSVKRAEGGEIPTLRAGLINNGANLPIPLSNGDDTLAYVGQGEVILNQEQQRRAGGSMFFRNLGVPGFADGGIIGGNTNLAPQGMKIDMDALAAKIGEQVGKANLNLPAPVTRIDDITTSQNTITKIREGANL